MKRVYFADIESTDFKENLENIDIKEYKLEFKLGCVISYDINKKMNYSYHSKSEIEYFNELTSNCSSKNRKIIYFHNLNFDSKFLMDLLYQKYEKIIPIKTNSRILGLNCYKKYENKSRKSKYEYQLVLSLKDSYAILITSISELGKFLKLPKLKFDFDYSDMDLAIKYCIRDCEIIYHSFSYIIDLCSKYFNFEVSVEKLPLTISSLAKKVFETYYPEAFYKVNKTIEKSLRKYYFGGRTEAFDFSIQKDVVGFDVNSLYPSVLSYNNFAHTKVFRIKTDSIDFRNEQVLAYKCLIKEKQMYPLYPERSEIGRIYFKNGLKKVIITKSEYEYFIKNKMLGKEIIIEKIYTMYLSAEVGNFSDYFLTVYNLRMKMKREKHLIFVYIFKIFMNSTYGKFAQRPLQKRIEFLRNFDIKDIENKEIYEKDGYFYTEQERFNSYLTINLLNGILTCSYARFELWKMLEICRNKKIPVLYCDTDSVYLKEKYLKYLSKYEDEYKLGAWKREYRFDVFMAIDSKEYICFKTDNKNKAMKNTESEKDNYMVKFKGIPKKYIGNLQKTLNHIVNGTNVNVIGTFFYCLNRHSDFRTIHITKKHKNTYFKKRIILPDLSTLPISDSDNVELFEKDNESFIKSQIVKLLEYV